jgi:chromosome segregation ATPase
LKIKKEIIKMEKKVNMRSTKDEIFTRLKEVTANLNELKKENLELTKKKMAVSKVDTTINTQLNGLDSAIGTINYIKSVYDDLSKVNDAIEFKKEQLKELTDIEYNVNTLEALIQANKEAKIKYEKEIKDLNLAYEEEEKELEKSNSRKMEEITYNVMIARKKLNNQLDEDAESRRKVIQEEEKELTKKVEEFREKENKFDELQERIKELEEGRTQAINEAVKTELGKQKAILTKDFNHEMALKDVKYEAEKENLDTKLLMIDRRLNDEIIKNQELANKLSEAYSKIEAIASKTVESSSDKALSLNLQEILKNLKKENNSK